MAGIPEDIVDSATYDGLRVLQEVVNRSEKDKINANIVSTANGIGTAFGGKN